ncbi:MAG: precorrin-2 C(20)-methyltransferase [Snowella sp.]|nr:precorrin-2 C(20)-methyltransferase [Snowella sp.]
MTNTIGTLYGVSVGTGDPELITVKGLKLLQNTSIIAFPAGINQQSGVAEKIITPWLNSQQQKIPLNFPYVQEQSILEQAWQGAAETLWTYLNQGHDVVFACEGDISFYSTFTYLAQRLEQQHPEAKIERIPGVCSPMAACSTLGIPLTVREQRLVILPALYTMSELEKALDSAEVVVLMKVSSVYESVWKILADRNLLKNAYIVEKATHLEEKIYRDLEQSPNLKLSYFSILIIQI